MQLKYSNYVAFSHFHGKAVNNSGLKMLFLLYLHVQQKQAQSEGHLPAAVDLYSPPQTEKHSLYLHFPFVIASIVICCFTRLRSSVSPDA